MKRVEELRQPYMAWWMSENKKALTEQLGGLKTRWKHTMSAVNDHHHAVVLLERRDMVGLCVPPLYLYEYHRKMPRFAGISPIKHVEVAAFKKDPRSYAGDLENTLNLVLVDDVRPVLGIASRYFSYELKADNEGKIGFRDDVAKYMFNDVIWKPPPKKPEAKKRKSLRESWKLPPRPRMSAPDKTYVARAVGQIRRAMAARNPDIEEIKHMDLSLD